MYGNKEHVVVQVDQGLKQEVDTLTSQLAENMTKVDISSKKIMAPAYSTSGCVAGWIDDDIPTAFLTNLKPLLDQYGYKTGLACITGNVGKSGSLTKQQLLDLQSNGHEVYPHSVTHEGSTWLAGNLINASETVINNELSQSQQFLKDNGFTTYDTFVYPGGGYTGAEADKAKRLAKQYYRYAINSVGNFRTFPIDDMLVDRCQPNLGQNFDTDIKPIIDSAIAKKALIIFISHSGLPGYWDSTLIGQVLSYLNANNIPVMPGRKALELKGNVLSIGDSTKNTSNKLIVDRDGNITLPTKFIDGQSPSNGFDMTTGITSFPPYCISQLLMGWSADSLTSEGGILTTYYSWVGSYLNKQEFVSNTNFRKFVRSWNETSSTWNAWKELPSTMYNAKEGKSTYSGDGTYKATIAHGLGVVPSYVSAQAGNQTASTAQITYVSADGTYVNVYFANAMPAGTNNIVIYWRAKP